MNLSGPDRSDIVNIIVETFKLNPSVVSIIGKGGNKEKKLQCLAEYAYVKAKNRNGVYLSKNKKGTALFFHSKKTKFSLKELYYELRFASSLSIGKVMQTLKREAYLNKHRCCDNYFYFWFLGVKKGGEKAGFELKNVVFKKANDEQLPILLETSVERNVFIYKRYGFEIYHIWDDTANNIRVWFMKWKPNPKNTITTEF